MREMNTAEGTPEVFLGNLYDEAVGLLAEVRDHMARRRAMGEDRDLDPVDRLRIRVEAFRLTNQLSRVMAWLLLRKAVHAGEISQRDAANGLDRFAVPLPSFDGDIPGDAWLAPDLCRLLRRSNDLYMRVTRLDRTVAGCRHEAGADDRDG